MTASRWTNLWATFLSVIVADPAMKQVHRVIAMVARGSISVLIVGETEVGKEVLASTRHHRSLRAGGPFVSIAQKQGLRQFVPQRRFHFT